MFMKNGLAKANLPKGITTSNDWNSGRVGARAHSCMLYALAQICFCSAPLYNYNYKSIHYISRNDAVKKY
jgi:hypothetical protein